MSINSEIYKFDEESVAVDVLRLNEKYTVIVDNADRDILERNLTITKDGYARFKQDGTHFYVHRVLMFGEDCLRENVPHTVLVDHKNWNRCDNRRSNIRECDSSSNLANSRKQAGTSSRFKGVSYVKNRGKYEAYIWTGGQKGKGGKKKYLGLFKSEEEAAKKYNEAALKFFGEFVGLNDVQ
jgi:hypothetical protein